MKLNRSQLRRLILREVNLLNERVSLESIQDLNAFKKEFHEWEQEQFKTNKIYGDYNKVQTELYNMYIEKAKELETKHGLDDNEYSSKIKNALKNTDGDIKRIMGEMK